MTVYNIYYDYCDDYGNEERNCINTVEVSSWGELQDIIRAMRQSDHYFNIDAASVYEEDEPSYSGEWS